MVELFLDRLAPGRTELELDHELEREEQVVQGHVVPGLRARVRGALWVDAMDHKILVHGSFTVEREMICDRSGEAFQMAYPAQVEVMILRGSMRGGEEMADDDSWVIHQSGGIVALDEALLEAIILDEPQHVVSPRYEEIPAVEAEDEEDEIDPRWEALRQLRESEGPTEAE